MASDRSQAGFTLVELLITMFLLSLATTMFLSVMLSVSRGSDRSRSVTRVSEEARLGFNRMVRDTREGEKLVAAEDDTYHLQVDFNADEIITLAPAANPSGDFEDLTFAWDAADLEIEINGEVLMESVDCIRPMGGGACTKPVFTYSSDRLEYDWDGNGTTSWEELDEAGSHGVVGIGNGDGDLGGAELPFVSYVNFAVRVVDDDSSSDFFVEAQLRNLR